MTTLIKLKLGLIVNFLLVFMIVISATVSAQNIQLMALFKNKAMVKIDGKQVLLHKDKKTRHGVTLRSANSEQAVIESDSVMHTYTLNMLIATQYEKREHAEVTIWANDYSMFHHNGKINGKNVNFLVDTGASAIAMSERDAKKLGVDYRDATKSQARTAAGIVNTWQVKLDQVQLGEIKIRDVGAIVIEGNKSQQILLGMTFLSRVKMTRSGQKMHLVKKW